MRTHFRIKSVPTSQCKIKKCLYRWLFTIFLSLQHIRLLMKSIFTISFYLWHLRQREFQCLWGCTTLLPCEICTFAHAFVLGLMRIRIIKREEYITSIKGKIKRTESIIWTIANWIMLEPHKFIDIMQKRSVIRKYSYTKCNILLVYRCLHGLYKNSRYWTA